VPNVYEMIIKNAKLRINSIEWNWDFVISEKNSEKFQYKPLSMLIQLSSYPSEIKNA
jgi:hypothetical protein